MKLSPRLDHGLRASLMGTTVPRMAAPFFREALFRGPSHGADGTPLVYLTFDDGPVPHATERLLHTLARHEAPALFFLLGERANQHPYLVRAVQAAGHRIGVHGWDHADAWRQDAASTCAAFDRATALLEDLTGIPIHDVRPPYGHASRALTRWGRGHAHRLVLWDLMPGDFVASASSQTVARLLLRRIRPGSIVVLHDGPHVTPDVLDLALPRLRASGWTLGTL